MRTSKTFLALALAFAMILSSVCVFAADTAADTTAASETATSESVNSTATFSDVQTGTVVGDAVAKLVTYGILSGYPDGTFKPDGEITRAEFAAVIARFNKIDTSLGSDAVTGFSDLDNDSSRAWARPYVKAAADAKIINGFEDGTFRAAEPVTYEQAVKMIICAIGYAPIAESELNLLKKTQPATVTWSSGYISAANKNNITKNAISANVTEAATRGTVAVLVSNAVDAPPIKVVTDKNGNVSYEKDSSSDSNKYEEIDGTVTGTYYTGLDKQFVDISKAEIRIKSSDEEKVYEMSSSVQDSVDLEDIIGKRVRAYFDSKTDQLVRLEVRNTTVTRVNEGDITSVSGGNVKYDDKNGKSNSLSIGDSIFIYNGKLVTDMTADDLVKDGGKYQLKSGYLEYIEAGSVKVTKVTSFDVFVVNSFDRTNRKIYFKYNQKLGANNYYEVPQKTSAIPEIYVGGKKTAYDSLSLTAYDVINLMQSPEGANGNALNKMFVTKGVKSGKVTSKTDDDREIEINDTSLQLAYNYHEYTPATSKDEEKAPFELSETYSYYLDYMGQIAAVKYNSSTGGTYKYGYIISAGKDRNSSSYLVRMFTQDGKDVKYTLKANVKLDGKKYSDSEAVDRLAETAQTASAAYNSAAPGWGAKALSGEYYSQPVRYSISGTTIDVIDTVVAGEGGTADSFSYDVKLEDGKKTKVTSKTALSNPTYGSFSVDTATTIIYVPDDRSADTEYAKLSSSTAFQVTGDKYIEAFNIDTSVSSKKAGFVVIYANNPSFNFTGSSPFMVVTKISNSGDNIVLEGYKNAAADVSKVTVSDDKFKTSIDSTCVKADEVEKGDLIRYITDSTGEAIAIQIWYDASNPKQAQVFDNEKDASAARTYVTTVGSSQTIRYGSPVSLDKESENKTMQLSFWTKDDKVADHTKNTLDVSITSNTKIYELADNGDVNKLETLDSVYDMDAENTSRIIMISSSTSLTTTHTARIIYLINK